MVAILQPLKNHKPIRIDRAVILVGRGEDCDVVITGSRKISRKHCCVVQADECFLIRDLGSTNGVWVNGKRVDQESEIADGDRIAIGDVQFRFLPNGLSHSESSKNSMEPANSVERMNPANACQQYAAEEVIEISDHDLVEDHLPGARIIEDSDSGRVKEADVLADDPSKSPSPPSKEESRPFQPAGESQPVIDLDENFSDQEIEDIIVFDDE